MLKRFFITLCALSIGSSSSQGASLTNPSEQQFSAQVSGDFFPDSSLEEEISSKSEESSYATWLKRIALALAVGGSMWWLLGTGKKDIAATSPNINTNVTHQTQQFYGTNKAQEIAIKVIEGGSIDTLDKDKIGSEAWNKFSSNQKQGISQLKTLIISAEKYDDILKKFDDVFFKLDFHLSDDRDKMTREVLRIHRPDLLITK